MNPCQFFIASDTSKEKLNLAVWQDGAVILEQEIENKVSQIRKFIKELRSLEGFSFAQALFCMEHTGIYNFHLLTVLQQLKATISIIPAMEIKLSLGIQRGKDDEIDARRIAQYAVRFTDKLIVWQPSRKVLEQLQHLNALRERLVKTLSMLAMPLKESKGFMDPKDYKLLEKNCRASMQAIKKDIEKIEKQVEDLIDSDDQLRKVFKQVKSVPGIGKVTAQNIIIQTNEFKRISDPRKFACHAGIAPFPKSSGSSIRGRSKVSHKANKGLKTLLHLGAMAAIRSKGELQDYYQRKVNEGKNKMSVLNAVRNKIVHRVFAVVRNDVTYQENYHFSFDKP